MGQFASSAKSLRKSERPTNYDTNSPTGNLSCFKPFGGISTFSIGGHMKKKLGRIFCKHFWVLMINSEWLKVLGCRNCKRNKVITERDGVIVK